MSGGLHFGGGLSRFVARGRLAGFCGRRERGCGRPNGGGLSRPPARGPLGPRTDDSTPDLAERQRTNAVTRRCDGGEGEEDVAGLRAVVEAAAGELAAGAGRVQAVVGGHD